jgi:hypothetical protein
VSDATLNNPTPQFGTAEYLGSEGNEHCQFCHQPLPQSYFRINDAMACPSCAEKGRAELGKDTHAVYMRGLAFGIGAAIVGMILYATFAITTGIIIGYISLAVGWMVGKAIIRGSKGVGGRRYQITAALLTYSAVSMAAVPIWIHYAGKQQNHQQQGAAEQRQLQAESGQSGNPASENVQPKPGLAEVLARMVLIGIASPLVEFWEAGPSLSWGIGLIILFVGIRIAWRITAGRTLEIYGPYNNSPQLTP